MTSNRPPLKSILIVACTALLSACSSAPQTGTIAADSDALCRYATGAATTPDYKHCRERLAEAQGKVTLVSATHIETPRPDVVALVRTPSDVAACKDAAAATCPSSGDITGSIPAAKQAPKR